MSIFDIFSPKPAAAPAPTAPAQAPATPAAPAAPNTDGSTPPNNAPVAAATPLDAFGTLWQTDPNAGNQPPPGAFPGLDAKTVFEASKKANFASAATAEQYQAIAAVGDGAIKAMQEVSNASTQAVFAQNTLATAKLIEQALTKTRAEMDAQLPGLVKRHTAADSLQTENPALSHPAAQPIISAIQAQMALKHPEATASQLAQMSKEYLANFANLAKTPDAPAAATKTNKQPEIDWDQWANM